MSSTPTTPCEYGSIRERGFKRLVTVLLAEAASEAVDGPPDAIHRRHAKAALRMYAPNSLRMFTTLWGLWHRRAAPLRRHPLVNSDDEQRLDERLALVPERTGAHTGAYVGSDVTAGPRRVAFGAVIGRVAAVVASVLFVARAGTRARDRVGERGDKLTGGAQPRRPQRVRQHVAAEAVEFKVERRGENPEAAAGRRSQEGLRAPKRDLLPLHPSVE